MKIWQSALALIAVLVGGVALTIIPAGAQKQDGPDTRDTKIRIGNTMPYSGPASAYGVIGQTEDAYFKMINDQGGINGRKIEFISYDDAYSRSNTVEQARRLIEDDDILFIFNSLGTSTNTAIEAYMNAKKVPQLFVATGAAKWNDPKDFFWTMGWQPSYQAEGQIYAQYLLQHEPHGKIGILYQDDDYGRDYVKGLTKGLAGKIPIVLEMPYELTDPTVDVQMTSLQVSGASIFFDVATPQIATQAIKKAAELGWRPLHILNNVSASIGAVLRPGGLANSKGIVSSAYLKDPSEPRWQNDSGLEHWSTFMDKYFPSGGKTNAFTVYGYSVAQTVVQVLRQCGDDITRDNVMKQAANLHDLHLDMLLPGITVNTSPTDYAPIKQLQMVRFTGERWELFGPILRGDTAAD
jgi:branched-chain amino acid transport system substrate-binding protein